MCCELFGSFNERVEAADFAQLSQTIFSWLETCATPEVRHHFMLCSYYSHRLLFLCSTAFERSLRARDRTAPSGRKRRYALRVQAAGIGVWFDERQCRVARCARGAHACRPCGGWGCRRRATWAAFAAAAATAAPTAAASTATATATAAAALCRSQSALAAGFTHMTRAITSHCWWRAPVAGAPEIITNL